MTLIQGPWKVPDGEEPEDRLPVVLPGRGRPRTRPGTELARQVVEAEIVGDDPPPTPVDQADPPVPGPAWSRQVQLAPLVPAWLADPVTRRQAARWWVRLKVRTVGYHALRLPLYEGRLLRTSAHGLGRAVVGAVVWVRDPETAGLLDGAKADAATARVLAVRQQRAAVRTALVAAAAVAALAAYWATKRTAAWWDLPLLVLAVLNVLGWAGRRRDRPIAGPAVVRPEVTRLTGPIVLRALNAAGLGGKKTKKTEDEDTAVGTAALVRDPVREGRGWSFLVDLPYGKTSTDAIEKHKQIASGLDVGAVQLFLDVVPDRERRLGGWVADNDPYAGKPTPSPNARCPRVSVWDPQRLGVDPRGRVVALPLIFNGFVVGSVPRQGKTFLGRNLVAPAILDPYCDVTVLGAKSSDWEHAEGVSVSYCAGEGATPMVEYAVAALRRLVDEAQAAYDAIRALPAADRPDGKITPDLQRRGFRPHVIVLEEAQNIFGHRDETGTKRSPLAKSALFYATQLAKVGPAAGYILIIATQRPSAEVIPTDLRDILSIHIALKVNDRASSDTILGDYRSARGIESATLINEVHAGVATIVGVNNGRGGDHTRMRGDLLTAEQFGRVCQVGRQRRLDARTLRGHAAGEADPIAVEVSLLDDLLAVWPDGDRSAWSETLCERLGNLRPDLYGGWGPAQLAAAVQPYRLVTKQLAKRGSGGSRANRRGLDLADVEKAADARATR